MKTKPTVILLVTFLVSLCPLFFNNLANGQDETRWWQRESPTPSANQAVNPAYLNKKRELEQAWDQLKQDMQAKSHFSSLGQNTSSLSAAISSSRNKVRNLEHELSQIPMYIPVAKGVAPTTTGVPPSQQHNAEIAKQNPVLNESSSSSFSGLRIRFDQFNHFRDPNGIDYRSYQKLGDVAAYIIRIYPALAMKDITSALEFSEKARNSGISMPKGVVGVTIMRDNNKYVLGNIRNARDLMTDDIRAKLSEFVENGAIFQFNFLDIPPYADIPFPTGTYYLEYSLWFPRAKNSFTYCHPNYKGRSPFGPKATTSWGPSKVVLGSLVVLT